MSGLYLRAEVAERGFKVEFTVAPGEVLAVLGPNGAGKSTALHLIAGLLAPDSGVVRLGDRVLTDTDAGVQVPTHRPPGRPAAAGPAAVSASERGGQRRVRGPGATTLPGRCPERCPALAARGRREQVADRKPRQLSGGQAQRVAIARALAGRPDVLLLDEPMAGLDVTVAVSVRSVLRRVLASEGRAAVLVTHDVLDVLTLADRVLVLERGRIVEVGAIADVLGSPRSTFGAQFAGVNLVNGTLAAKGVLRSASGTRWHGVASEDLDVGDAAVAVFTPAAVAVYLDAPHGSPRNVVEGTVAELDALGGAIRVRAGGQSDGAPGLAADITPESAADLRVTPGDRVWFTVKAQEVAIHSAHRSHPPAQS